jgi:hypothetical protein
MRCFTSIVFALAAASIAEAATVTEDFSLDPRARGWRAHGATNLFNWNPTGRHLEVTWDSSHTNSHFYLPLGDVLATNDDFGVELDLWLEDIAVGLKPNQPFSFELAFGFIRFANATNVNFRRGAGVNPTFGPRNLVEFDYFPDSGYGATIWPALVSSNGQFNYRGFGDYVLGELTSNRWFHISMTYTSSNRGLATVVLRDGQPYVSHQTRLTGTFNDFRLDTFALCSYSDWGSDGSLLAHGIVDNIQVNRPDPAPMLLSGSVTNGTWQVTLLTRSNWVYSLQRSSDLHEWPETAAASPGDGGWLTLVDTNPPASRGFYRVRAERP